MLFPTTFKSAVVFGAIVAAVFVVVFTVTPGGAMLGLVVVALAAAVLYYSGYRIDDALKNGKS